uniref:Uncharacterized protein n=1 Tax=Chromera velia CCMP2878 TaxID=1169474 RepID=A0A0G4HAH5_9ALVE|eukprot:Cvel_25546.t1-p1 / transcript=Cvel_25546.t1 / gene=Cvel_25546 / organism=Chromera_velia_CCMP2878 / gene_product=hypothetical protein / transcript_product=hypothetical protein / location=Cvel_scaffold2908:6251-6991(-) / protein_length=247 / sequence_SO=supercontig / SO=protein_coding / is_pseudo=false
MNPPGPVQDQVLAGQDPLPPQQDEPMLNTQAQAAAPGQQVAGAAASGPDNGPQQQGLLGSVGGLPAAVSPNMEMQDATQDLIGQQVVHNQAPQGAPHLLSSLSQLGGFGPPAATGPSLASAVANALRPNLRNLDLQTIVELQRQGFTFRVDTEGNLVPIPIPPEQASHQYHTSGRQQNHRDMPRIKMDLPSFSGDDRAQTKPYWGRMLRLYERMGWNFLDFRDIYFPSTLTGKAKTWYDQLPPGRLP